MALIFAALFLLTQPVLADFLQQGPKLVGTGAVGPAEQGSSVALSGDGNTLIVGGPNDNGVGATWVYTRSNGVWTQQGPKLVGGGGVNPGGVALSRDGNTAIVGVGDKNGVGGALIYTRSNGVWTQQGPKLVGAGAVGRAGQGVSVSLSGDGNTAIVGGYADNLNSGLGLGVGAAWVFTRSNEVWTQQGPKLVGTGAVGPAGQGVSVAMSGDGNTAIVGGMWDNNGVGATWVYTRGNGVWTQQGPKLVGGGGVGPGVLQGASVALSGDGNTAIVGGPNDTYESGAAWVFTRSNGVWTQQGPKLVGTGVSNAEQGYSVALSGDGNTAIVGGPLADMGQLRYVGAAWVFTRSNGVWTQRGYKLVGGGAVGGAREGLSVALSGDGDTFAIGGPTDGDPAHWTGAAWVFAKPFVAFAQFSAQLQIRLEKDLCKDAFALESDFTLGNASNGINPLTEPVTLKVGTFSTVVPAGSFKQHGASQFVFDGVIGGVKLKALIKSEGSWHEDNKWQHGGNSKRYAFFAEARHANLAGTKNPVSVTLTIGDDTRTTSVTAKGIDWYHEAHDYGHKEAHDYGPRENHDRY